MKKDQLWIFIDRVISLAIFSWLFISVSFVPSLTGDVPVIRFDEPLRVAIPINAPPFVALSDEGIKPLETWIPEKPNDRVWLSLESSSVNVLVTTLTQAKQMQQINSLKWAHKPKTQKVQKSNSRVLELEGMSISAIKVVPKFEELNEKEIVAKNIKIEPEPVDRSFADRWLAFQEKVSDYSESQDLMAASSGTEREDISDAVEELPKEIRDKVDDAMTVAMNDPTKNKQKWVGDIWVGLPDQKPTPKPAQHSSDVNNQPKPQRPRNDNVAQNPPRTNEPDDFKHGLVDGDMPPSEDPILKPWPVAATLKGPVTLNAGLAHLGGTDHLRIYRLVAGGAVEEAMIDYVNGIYEIDIESPEVGALVAELRDKNGNLIGFSEDLLFDHKEAIVSNPNKAIVPVTVAPVDNVTNGRILTLNNRLEANPTKSGKIEIDELGYSLDVKEEGTFSISSLLQGSSFIARIKSSGLWKALFETQTSGDNNVSLPGRDLLRNVESQITSAGFPTDAGMVWGRVTQFGKPMQGARVEMASETARGPYYLDENNKIFTQGGTGKNGIYFYFGLNEGTHLIRAKISERNMPAKVIRVRAGHISLVDLAKARKQKAEVYIYDMTTEEPLHAAMRFKEAESSAETENGFMGIKFYKNRDALLLEARTLSPGYADVLVTAQRDRKIVQIPVPPVGWLSRIQGATKTTEFPDKVKIIGKVQGDDFVVHPPDTMLNDHTRVVYFDDNGEISEFGTHRGGFVIYNANEGVHNLIIENSQGRVALRLIVAEAEKTSVINHKF